jgi:hypothetical protein
MKIDAPMFARSGVDRAATSIKNNLVPDPIRKLIIIGSAQSFLFKPLFAERAQAREIALIRFDLYRI